MPNVTLHALLADRVLEDWARRPGAAPFDAGDERLRNAFLQGAFGPDIGYFPGGDRFLSDLAHYVRSGDLTRALVGLAETPSERAYAWGWVTHVLADQAIHPLVGEAAGEVVHGRRGEFVGISENRTAHVRVEVGLDAWVSRRNPRLRARSCEPVFDRRTVGYLRDAYLKAYALEVDPTHLLTSHLCAVRMSELALGTIGILGSTFEVENGGETLQGTRWVLEQILAVVHQGMDRESMTLAFLNLVPPRPWLRTSVEEIADAFAGRFREAYEGGLDALPNYNLDNGRAQEDGVSTPRAEEALRSLTDLGGAGLQPPENGRPPARYRGVRR